MQRLMTWYLGWLAAGAALVLSTRAVSASTVLRLTEADFGSRLELQIGSRLEIVLGGNPTAGYQWEGSSWDEAVLRLLDEPTYTQYSRNVGSGGEFTFTFGAIDVGQTEVELIYRRPFARRGEPLKTFQVTVVVR